MLLPMVAIRGWDSHLWYVPKVLAVHRNAPGDGVQNRRSEVGWTHESREMKLRRSFRSISTPQRSISPPLEAHPRPRVLCMWSTQGGLVLTCTSIHPTSVAQLTENLLPIRTSESDISTRNHWIL